MNPIKTRKILIKIRDIEKEIEDLKAIRLKLASTEYKSATISSGGGSKSYTRMDMPQLESTISELMSELDQYRRMLFGYGKGTSKTSYISWGD